MIVTEVAKYEEVWPHIEEMVKDHFEEVSLLKDKLELDVDLGFYHTMHLNNRLELFSIKDGDVWVGYVIFITMPNHHRYKTKSVAANDVLYLKPEYRQGRAGINVIKYVNAYLKSKYDMVVWHVKDQHDFSPILLREGFTKQDVVYAYVGE